MEEMFLFLKKKCNAKRHIKSYKLSVKIIKVYQCYFLKNSSFVPKELKLRLRKKESQRKNG